MTAVVLSIGSNLGDRMAQLSAVLDELGAAVRAVSAVYETDPWGPVEQGPFLNAVVLATDRGRDAPGWLSEAHRLEAAAGRVRDVHWGPRTLDVDLIACRDDTGAVRSDTEALTLPHPRAHLRAFVLVPWLDVEPGATLPVDGRDRALPELLADLPDAERAGVRRTGLRLTR